MISPASGSSSSASRTHNTSGSGPKPLQTKWRTATQQKIYGRRLLDALRATGASGGGTPQPRAVKTAADSALALTARGQTRWSRAILLSGAATCRRRVLVKAGGKIRRHHRRPRPTKTAVLEPPALKERKVKERLRVLGRLVPGCRKLPAPALLEETADYVAALEMQVKTMRALADALAAAQLDDAEMER